MKLTLLLENYKTKLLVLLLAIILWLSVKLNRVYDYSFDVPLQIVTTNPQYCLKFPVPRTVRVQFVGKGIDLLRLPYYPIAYQVDLSDVTERRVLNLSEHPEYVSFPEELDVSVKSIVRPLEVAFEVDRCSEKKVPVEVRAEASTAPGFTLVSIQPEPDSVLVKGPASYVDTLRKVVTEKKTFAELSMPVEETFRIQNSPLFLASYVPPVVQVLLDVQRIAEKEVENVPVEVVNVPPDLEVLPLPSFVRIYMRGGEKLLARATAQDFRVVIDFQRDWSPEKKQIKGRIVTPYQLLYVESIPSHFELIVQKKRAE